MVAMEYFWVHFATDKLDIATSIYDYKYATLMLLENDLDFYYASFNICISARYNDILYIAKYVQ